MISLTSLEKKLIEQGLNSFTMHEKNNLITIIANKENKMYYEVDEDYILDYHKRLKIEILSEACEETIINGFTASNGHRYRTNRDDQINMIGQKDMLMVDPSITTVEWKTEDAGYIIHTRDEWLEVYKEAFNYKKTQLLKYNDLK